MFMLYVSFHCALVKIYRTMLNSSDYSGIVFCFNSTAFNILPVSTMSMVEVI